LLTNAIDATPPGGTIRIGAEVVDAGERQRAHFELSVADSGHGMSAEELRHAFEPFYTTKAPHRGTGLGLVIVEHIVRAHGGHLIAQSAPGQGTVVRVRLPLDAP
jgi:signal transduction histidine kinase